MATLDIMQQAIAVFLHTMVDSIGNQSDDEAIEDDEAEEVGDAAGHQQPAIRPFAEIDIAIGAGIDQQEDGQGPDWDASVLAIGLPFNARKWEQEKRYQQQDNKQDQQYEDLPAETARHGPIQEQFDIISLVRHIPIIKNPNYDKASATM